MSDLDTARPVVGADAAQPLPVSKDLSPASASNPLPAETIVGGAAVGASNQLPAKLYEGGSEVGPSNPLPSDAFVGGAAASSSNPMPTETIVGGSAVSSSNPLPVSSSEGLATTADRDAFVDQFVDGGSSEAMNVDGNTTPVEFTIDADSTQDTYVTEIVLNLVDEGLKDLDDFGDGVTASNGLLVEYTTNGVTKTIVGGIDSLNTIFQLDPDARWSPEFNRSGTAMDMLFTKIWNANERGKTAIFLAAGTSDNVKITVQDDLQAVNRLEAVARGVRI